MVVPGGQRRPAEHPALAAWRVLRESRAGTSGPVVQACPGCGQPMVSDLPGAKPLQRWVLEVGGEQLEVGEQIRGPQGAIADEAVQDWLVARLPPAERNPAGAVAFAGLTTLGALVVFAMWVAAALFVTWFIVVGIPHGALAPM